MAKKNLEKVIVVLAVIGALIAAYGVALHYSPDSSSFCNISANINCDKVNKSPWATFLGVPVALLGMLAYLAVVLLVLKRNLVRKITAFTKKDYWQYLTGIVAVMLLFQVYLTWVELFLIKAYCLICLGSQLIILVLFVVSFIKFRRL
ncbi:vitamin K epoxide reductase family protein [Candidatus Woesearchaeota archaeon]|nr:vitamin K epoxide reductase family protein [Candidatus Woesearchaeota archaeon]